MPFQDDVNNQIQRNRQDQEAKKAEEQRRREEQVSKTIEAATYTAYSFYRACVDAAAAGKHSLTMYIAEILGGGGYYHAISLISLEQGQQALRSPYGTYPEPNDEDYSRNASGLPQTVAAKAAEGIVLILRAKGLPNPGASLVPVKLQNHNRPHAGRSETCSEPTFFIRLSANW